MKPGKMAIPGMDEYMSEGAIDIPNNDDGQTGDGTDVTKEVNPDGEPLTDEEQDKTRIDPWDLKSGKLAMELFAKGAATMFKPPHNDMDEYSQTWKDSSGEMPYCPVYVTKLEDGGRKFEAYVTGSINDVDDYIDLIDTLLIATEKDKYFIYIDSPGGLIAAGGIIASAIQYSKATVITEARGICASAAALIHSSAKPGNAISTPFAVMMYHMSSHWDGGYSTKVAERALNQVRYVNECLLNKALADGHITEDEFNAIQNGKDIFVPAATFERRVAGGDDDDDVIPGQEDFSGQPMQSFYSQQMSAWKNAVPMWGKEPTEAEMAAFLGGNGPKGKETALLIRTSDKQNFRIYMKAEWWFTQRYINGICRFLDSRKEGETVTFILGTKMSDWQAHIIGAVIGAIMRCKASIRTIAAGYCSIPESLIWCFGQQRDMMRYGALTFCTTEFLDHCKEYRAYFEYVFKKAIEIGVLSEEDVQSIWDTGREKQILYCDYKELFPE